jgi:hypothetical protein
MGRCALLLTLAACAVEPVDTDDTGVVGTDTDEVAPGDLLIAGTWSDPYGGETTVSNDAWVSWGYTHHLTRWDNDAGWVVGENDAANPTNGGQWSRFDWAWVQGELWYCQTAYDAATEDAALATAPADAASPAAGGCGGFPWTWLRERLWLTGTWTDTWAGEHVIDAFAWKMGASTFHVLSADKVDGVIIAENDGTNEYFPGKYSRFDTVWKDEGGWYFCQTAFDAATAEAAEATAPADDANLESGCGGFGWSHLSPVQ